MTAIILFLQVVEYLSLISMLMIDVNDKVLR